MADRDPWVRSAGCGRHAAGQQGETLLPTLGDRGTDGLIEGGIMEGGMVGVYGLDLWMCLEAGREISIYMYHREDFQMSQNVLGGFTSPIHRLTIVLIHENNLMLKLN